MTAPAGTLPVPAPATNPFSGLVARVDAAVLAVCGDQATYTRNVTGAQPFALLVALNTATEDNKQSPGNSKTPTLTVDVRVSDVAVPQSGDRITIGDATYSVQHKVFTDLGVHTLAVQRG